MNYPTPPTSSTLSLNSWVIALSSPKGLTVIMYWSPFECGPILCDARMSAVGRRARVRMRACGWESATKTHK